VLQSSITGAPSLVLSLCCGSPWSVKEFEDTPLVNSIALDDTQAALS